MILSMISENKIQHKCLWLCNIKIPKTSILVRISVYMYNLEFLLYIIKIKIKKIENYQIFDKPFILCIIVVYTIVFIIMLNTS